MSKVYFNGGFYALFPGAFYDEPTLVFTGKRDLCLAFMVESRREDRTIADAVKRGKAWERGEIPEWVRRMVALP